MFSFLLQLIFWLDLDLSNPVLLAILTYECAKTITYKF